MLYLFKLSSLCIDTEISEPFERYYNMESVEEILMNLDLDSSVNVQSMMLEYIESKHGREIIKQIYDLDKVFLERNFPIGDLPDHEDFVEL